MRCMGGNRMGDWFKPGWRCRHCGALLRTSYDDCVVCFRETEDFDRRLRAIPRHIKLVRKAGLLYARHDAHFPDRCIVTNRETVARSALRCPMEHRYFDGKNPIAMALSCVVGIATLLLPFFTRM